MQIAEVLSESGDEARVLLTDGRRVTIVRRPGMAWQDVLDDLPSGPEEPAVPSPVSDRQFAHALAVFGFITQQEAIAWVSSGAIPSAIQAIVAAIPDPAQQFSATMLLAGAVEFHRGHPLVDAIGAAQGVTSQQIDELFILAASL